MMPSHNRRTRHLQRLGLGRLRRAVVLGRHVDDHAPLQDVEDDLVLLELVLVRDDRLGEHKVNWHVGAEHVRGERLDDVHHLVGALAAVRRAEPGHLLEVRAVRGEGTFVDADPVHAVVAHLEVAR